MTESEAEAQTARERAGEAAAALVQDRMALGYGTGRAAEAALRGIARRVQEQRLELRPGVATSRRTAELCTRLGLPLARPGELPALDLCIDGADEVDPGRQALKGGGGALTREKLVALAAKTRVLVFEAQKRVSRLGATRPLPIELLEFGATGTLQRICKQLPGAQLRHEPGGGPARSDNGGLLADAPLPAGRDLRELARELKLITGVIEHGLFLDLSPILVIGTATGAQIER